MAVGGCVQKDDVHPPNPAAGGAATGLRYPYLAPVERQQQILNGYQRVHLGMSKKDVMAVLGAPDEKNATYEAKISNPRQVGFSYVYIVQRLKASGSVDAMQEKLVRVHFDEAGSVIRVIPVGIVSGDAESSRGAR
jgi:hypothetical protein